MTVTRTSPRAPEATNGVQPVPPRPGAEPKRRLPIQIANENRMIRATIKLLADHPVDAITSRMIADRSGTATNYISRYFGGKDGLLVAAANELARQISDLVRSEQSALDPEQGRSYIAGILSIPEISLWFKLYRHLTGRDVDSLLAPYDKPDLVSSIEETIQLIFGLEGEYVPICANVFITYIMGYAAFGAFLGTTEEEAEQALHAMAAVVHMLVDHSRTATV